MLFAVGSVAGRSRPAQLGYALFDFGLWNIFYYAWLRALLGWPGSLLTHDLLLLFLLPWWGPVIAPVFILGLMVGGGTLLVLYAFMAAALAALPGDPETLSCLCLSSFNWPEFLLGLAGIGWPVWRAAGIRGRH